MSGRQGEWEVSLEAFVKPCASSAGLIRIIGGLGKFTRFWWCCDPSSSIILVHWVTGKPNTRPEHGALWSVGQGSRKPSSGRGGMGAAGEVTFLDLSVLRGLCSPHRQQSRDRK